MDRKYNEIVEEYSRGVVGLLGVSSPPILRAVGGRGTGQSVRVEIDEREASVARREDDRGVDHPREQRQQGGVTKDPVAPPSRPDHQPEVDGDQVLDAERRAGRQNEDAACDAAHATVGGRDIGRRHVDQQVRVGRHVHARDEEVGEGERRDEHVQGTECSTGARARRQDDGVRDATQQCYGPQVRALDALRPVHCRAGRQRRVWFDEPERVMQRPKNAMGPGPSGRTTSRQVRWCVAFVP